LCDGKPLAARPASEFDVFVMPGSHSIGARFESHEAVQQQIELGPGERLILSLETGTASGGRASHAAFSITEVSRGHSVESLAPTDDVKAPRWMFWSAVGVTGALTVGAIASGVDTLHRHQVYEQETTQERYDAGVRSQRRTNLLLLGAGVTAALTAGLGFFTDWGGEAAVVPTVDPSRRTAAIQVTRRF
jgi:hypothetical protein